MSTEREQLIHLSAPRSQEWLISAVAAVLIASAACGGEVTPSDAPTTVAEPNPTYQVIEVTTVPAAAPNPTPTATTEPTPSATASTVTGTVDDEQVLFDLWDRQRVTTLGEQWELVTGNCTPGFREGDARTPAQIEEAYRIALNRSGLVFEHMSFGEPEIMILGSTGTVQYDVFQNGEKLIEWIDIYTKSGSGAWYRNCVGTVQRSPRSQ
ncbi:MAG: hypothetical protein QF357_11590 [Dehalococcoidia bacterium]|nr:hypothetical protein [Dehalococcoidia bacterium]